MYYGGVAVISKKIVAVSQYVGPCLKQQLMPQDDKCFILAWSHSEYSEPPPKPKLRPQNPPYGKRPMSPFILDSDNFELNDLKRIRLDN